MARENQRSRRSTGNYRAGVVAILVTAALCAAALVYRVPIRSLMWARQASGAADMRERAAALTQLCNAGDAGRWGTESLLRSSDAESRQLGVIVLQHVGSEWSRNRLLQMLHDPSEATADMAALGLAIHGDVSVIPRLKRMYLEGSDGVASAACLALERLGGTESVSAILELADADVDAEKRAALIEALTTIGGREAARRLVGMLDDHRPVETESRSARLLRSMSGIAGLNGLVANPETQPASPSVPEPGHDTVADRAAAALARITGLSPPFASNADRQVREEAARKWNEWINSAPESP